MISMKRLWVHEILRIYHDRLVDDSDRSWFIDTLRSVCKESLNENMDKMFIHLTSKENRTVKSKNIFTSHIGIGIRF